jgi:hypothetical protein
MFLMKIDRSVELADHDSALRYGLPRRLEAIDFRTPPPPEVFAAHRNDTAPADL